MVGRLATQIERAWVAYCARCGETGLAHCDFNANEASQFLLGEGWTAARSEVPEDLLDAYSLPSTLVVTRCPDCSRAHE